MPVRGSLTRASIEVHTTFLANIKMVSGKRVSSTKNLLIVVGIPRP